MDSNSGKLWAFGDNSEAALGDGTQTQASENDLSRAFVVLGPTLTPIVRFASVSAGLYHTLALAGSFGDSECTAIFYSVLFWLFCD